VGSVIRLLVRGWAVEACSLLAAHGGWHELNAQGNIGEISSVASKNNAERSEMDCGMYHDPPGGGCVGKGRASLVGGSRVATVLTAVLVHRIFPYSNPHLSVGNGSDNAFLYYHRFFGLSESNYFLREYLFLATAGLAKLFDSSSIKTRGVKVGRVGSALSAQSPIS
jgi:hypothetical protein